MIALSDTQLKTVMAIASDVPTEKRPAFLERVAAMLELRGRGHFGDKDVTEITQLALTGLAFRSTACRTELPVVGSAAAPVSPCPKAPWPPTCRWRFAGGVGHRTRCASTLSSTRGSPS